MNAFAFAGELGTYDCLRIFIHALFALKWYSFHSRLFSMGLQLRLRWRCSVKNDLNVSVSWRLCYPWGGLVVSLPEFF